MLAIPRERLRGILDLFAYGRTWAVLRVTPTGTPGSVFLPDNLWRVPNLHLTYCRLDLNECGIGQLNYALAKHPQLFPQKYTLLIFCQYPQVNNLRYLWLVTFG